ncbi:MAG: CPBP family intramembrane metalloprotease [Spirochaetales bacterium]|nr:CPBP family intramembrane metalloprotease [Spirochaetales bacterium]
MKKHLLLVGQIAAVALSFPLFFLWGRGLNPLNAFLCSFLSYWTLLFLTALPILWKNPPLRAGLRRFLKPPEKNLPLALLNFLPLAGVIVMVVLPHRRELTLPLLALVFLISLANGALEEIFWRGLTLARYESSPPLLALSTGLFVLFHLAFLLLPLTYQGGPANLIGGALIMGILWLVLSKRTGTILMSLIAHVLVNWGAFSGLFIDNQLLIKNP